MAKGNNGNEKAQSIELHLEQVDGENLVSPRKVYLFDDDKRYLQDKNISPKYLLTKEKRNALVGGLFKAKKGHPTKWYNYITKHLRTQTEDEVRSALGACWIQQNGLQKNLLESFDPIQNYVAYPQFITKKKYWKHDLVDIEPWYTNDRKVPERRERITFRAAGFGPEALDKHQQKFHPGRTEIAELALNIYLNEQKFVYHWKKANVYYRNTGRRHVDYTTTYFKPFSFKELEGTSYMNKPLYYKCKSDYNFYIRAYESLNWRASADGLDDTALLPDINVFLIEEDQPDFAPGHAGFTDAHKQITLWDELPKMFKDVLNEAGEKIGESSKGRYFEKWSKAYNDADAIAKANFTKIKRKSSNVLVPYETNKKLFDYHNKRFMFPIFCEIDFSTDTNTSLADLLVDAKLDGSILKTIIEGVKGDWGAGMKRDLRFTSMRSMQTVEKNSHMHYGTHGGETAVDKDVPREVRSFRLYDDSAWNWIGQYRDKGAEIYKNKEGEDFTVLAHFDSEYYDMLHEPPESAGQSKFLKNLMMTIFKAKFTDILKIKTRSFRQILEGRPAQSETLAYRIEKWICDEAGEPKEVVQNYYYSNTRKLDILKHVDTQLRYGKKYHYKVFSWRVIYGTEYEYELAGRYLQGLQTLLAGVARDAIGGIAGIGQGSIASDLAKLYAANKAKALEWFKFRLGTYQPDLNNISLDVDIISRPNVQIIEVPYFSCSTRIMDSPPIPPNVNIIPYKNVNNQVLINLSSNTGEVKQEPIVIETENGDEESLKNIYEAQELLQGSIIEFQSDDPPQSFQVFRTTDEPTSYQDFKGTMREHDVGPTEGGTTQGFSSFSLVDNLTPNTKYYYVFRVKDIHGHVSNPTEIYKVELIDNSGAIYLLIDIFEIEKKKLKSTKSMKKYISVIPTEEQRFINEKETQIKFGEDGIGETAVGISPVLGHSEETIFNRGPEKHFKIRLISKKTGRKIDINVAFETKHMNIEVKKKEDIMDSDSATVSD